MELSGEVNKAIHIFEVVLRNAIVREWNNHFTCTEWPMNKLGIPSTRKYQDIFDDIDTATIRTKKRHPNNGDVIASLMLGFWKKMLSSKFDVQNIHFVKNIFPNKAYWSPRTTDDIENLYKQIETIWDLRNRVAHHEPIFHLRDLRQKFSLILEIIEMVDRDSLYLLQESKFEKLMNDGWDK
jgi:hypothetical protein